MSKKQATRSQYGTLGLDVGWFGRWSRLVWGLLILVPTVLALIQDFNDSGISLRFAGFTVLYFIAITVAYTAVYWFLGERLFATANPRGSTQLYSLYRPLS